VAAVVEKDAEYFLGHCVHSIAMKALRLGCR
jgi:hypothetical protein